MLGGLRSAFLSVGDINAVKVWYTELLGYPPYFDEDFYVGFDVDGYELGLIPSDGGEGVEAAWAVDDPAAVIDQMVSLGATVSAEPRDVGDGIIAATVVDPFGNRLGLLRNPTFAPKLVEASSDDVSERSIEVSKVVPADPRSAWDLWASEEGLARWWTENTRVDLRPGGYYEVHFNPDEPPGNRGGDWCRVLSFLPGRMLSFTWNAPPHLKTRPLLTWVVLSFERDEAGSLVTLSHLGWPRSGLAEPESDWPATFEYFETAWTFVMDKFEAHFLETP